MDTVDTTIANRVISAGLGTLVLAVVLLALSVMITRSILRQLGGEPSATADITHRIAKGDLTVNIPLEANDTSSLLHAIQSMRDSFANIVG